MLFLLGLAGAAYQAEWPSGFEDCPCFPHAYALFNGLPEKIARDLLGMKRLFLFLLVVMCASCAKDHNKPSADLRFLSVEREGDFTLYDIHYSSDVNLLDLYGRGEGEGVASTMFQCALGDDQDFTVENRLRLSAYGLIRADEPRKADGKFNYVTRAFLSEVIDNGSSQRNLSVGELNSVLSNRQSVPCKVVITAYGFKPYYSSTMYIPAVDLLREVNKPREK